MTKTKADLIEAAMFKADQIATGQRPSADEAEKVGATIDGILAALAQLKVVYVSNVDQIEDAFMEDLAVIVAEAIIKTRGPDEVIIKRSEDRLKKMQLPQPARRTLQTDPILRHGFGGLRH